jgi:carnitine O-acetyltransferase
MKGDAYAFFGPLVTDGYGCCYTMREEKITVSITAFNSSEDTSCIKFSQTLESCLNDMREMLISAAKFK